MYQAIKKIRFHGIRKLNWIERSWNTDYNTHLHKTTFDQWIKLSPLTIIIGPNGGGKSTIIDLLRSVSNAKIWPTLPRENYPSHNFSGFNIVGAWFEIKAFFSKATPEDTEKCLDFTNVLLSVNGKCKIYVKNLLLPKFSDSGQWQSIIQTSLDKCVGLQVYYLPSTGLILDDDFSDEKLVALLNELSVHFPSVLSKADAPPFLLFDGYDSGIIGVLYKDDSAQYSMVRRKFLPSGWLQLVSILSFLRECNNGSLVLLDEADRHLHPTLQRTMMNIISKEINQRNIQVVVATHSPVIINPTLLNNLNITQVFKTSRDRFSLLSNMRSLLDDLGVKSSDAVLSNGIIWVEGPSDRIYIKAWLDYYAKSKGMPPFIEDTHYSLLSYGGALIKHLTFFDESSEKVNLEAINRNWFIVMDRDMLNNGDQLLKEEKERILQEARKLNRESAVWITQDYTIEGYLPEVFDNKIIRGQDKKISVKGSKVELANQFSKKISSWNESFREGTDLPDRIQQLFKVIESW